MVTQQSGPEDGATGRDARDFDEKMRPQAPPCSSFTGEIAAPAISTAAHGSPRADACPTAPPSDGLTWHSPGEAPFQLAGFPWFEQERVYRRLPLSPPEPLPEAVDALANSTAGGQIRFQTDSRRIAVRVQLSGPANMNHMPATGQCGFDLYVGPPGQVRYHNTTKYDHTQTAYQIELLSQPDAEMRVITLYFPLYQGVREVAVGLEPGAAVTGPPEWSLSAPIAAYGTSITQGGCAARPGMAYTNILSRALNAEFINLGFSGSGCGEPEVARLIADLTPCAIYILDYEANSGGTEQYRRTLPEFVRILRQARTDTPVLVVSRIPSGSEAISAAAGSDRHERLTFQRQLVEDLRQAGDSGVHFCDGSHLLGEDYDECTVDGSHPTDLGFWRMAQNLEPVVRSILGP